MTSNTSTDPNSTPIRFHSLRSIIAFILFPPLWCFSVPAIIFSSEAKKFYMMGAYNLAYYFADKSKRFSTAALICGAAVSGAVLILWLFMLSGLV